MLNDLLYNLKTAYVAVFLMGIVSVFILGGNDLLATRAGVLEIMSGQNELGVDIPREISVITANSESLLALAQNYVEPSNSRAADVRAALNDAGAEAGLFELEAQFAGAGRLASTTQPLIAELKDMDLDPRSAGLVTDIEANINAALARIDSSGYYASVRDFNRLLRNPYTRLIAAVRGVDELRFAKLW